jgi:hypothetical protein
MKALVHRHESRWHAAYAVLLALLLYVTLPPKVIVGPVWMLPLVVLVALVPLTVLTIGRGREVRWQRPLAIAMVAVLNAFNVLTIALLFDWQLSSRGKHLSGETLLLASIEIWLTNVIVYALWFWEIDGGGPAARAHTTFEADPRSRDFLFPQMALQPPIREALQWESTFMDYVFLAFTNATAFSPTDTMPLTPIAKVLMMAEALSSLVTIAVIASRAVGILGS